MSDSPTTLLTLRDVQLIYARRRGIFSVDRDQVLSGVNLNLNQGETLGVVGRNGSGKSTLLRVMAGILSPTSGEVSLRYNTSRAVLALGLGFKGELTGRDNAYLSSIMQGNSRETANCCLEEIKDFSELGRAFEKPVNRYSSGMRSRLAFSAALISHVDILMIDEILSVGDGHFRKKAGEALREKIKGEQTVVFVSHSAGEVKRLCNRVMWLEQGLVKMLDKTEQVVDAYVATL